MDCTVNEFGLYYLGSVKLHPQWKQFFILFTFRCLTDQVFGFGLLVLFWAFLPPVHVTLVSHDE